ncbi:MAG TPA: S41 family peptidase [Thermoanaerobaculia bacterium]|nr:S41 family peptidase [Thermoanaerobaculia bacterium]
MKRSWRNVGLVLFTIALLTGALFGTRLEALGDDARQTLRLYTELVTVAQERYGAEVAYEDLVYASIQGMLRTLDPHTSFLPPRAYTGMRERQQSSFYGLGIVVSTRNGQLTVISPIDGTPASQVGLRAGDVISAIEGEPTDKMSLDEAVDKLKGPKDTQVHITVVRRGFEEPLELDVTRAEIPQNTVRQAYLIEPGTGYVQISDFNRATGEEVADAIAKLRAQGMERLLVDLRNNGGGLLDQAILVSDQFLPDGAKIVETKGRTRDSFQTYRSTDRYSELGVPVVVLVNRGTASAAEILAGAIQDHDVGVVVGTPTWGKGLVQTVYNLSYGAGLALTTAKYYTPSGRLIQRDYSSFYDYYNYEPAGQPEDGTNGTEPAAPGGNAGEAFYTDTGRAVYGGGGITPDVVVEHEDISAFSQHLLAHNAFFDYAVDVQNKKPVRDADWTPPEDALDRFSEWLVAQGVAEREQIAEGFADAATRDFARLQIHAEVFNAAFGQEARHRVLAQGDVQVREAIDQFQRARDLLASRQAAAAAGQLGRPNRPAPRATAESAPEVPPVVRPGSDG